MPVHPYGNQVRFGTGDGRTLAFEHQVPGRAVPVVALFGLGMALSVCLLRRRPVGGQV
jgi:hypothetical protein